MIAPIKDIPADADNLHTFYLSGDKFCSIEIAYSGFANSGGSVDGVFKVLRTNQNPAPKLAADWVEETVFTTQVNDVSGLMLFEFSDPIVAEAIALSFEHGGVDAGSYNIIIKRSR